MTDSLVAVLSDEGRTKVTVAPVAVTDDTETLVGAANLGRNSALGDIFITRLGNDTPPADIIIARNTANTVARPNQTFLMHLIMRPDP